MSSQRSRVIELYKKLQYMGREYPGGAEKFRKKCHNAFMKNREEKDPEKIEKMIQMGNYIIKELEALYSLRKYRAMKSRYYQDPLPSRCEEEYKKIVNDNGEKVKK